MKGNIRNSIIGSVALAIVFTISCIKPAHEEEYGPVQSKSCTDGTLNQGEYFTDCGGPCAPCAINSYVNFTISGETWNNPDTTAQKVNSSKDSVQYIDTSLIRIVMVETSTLATFNFVIDKTWRGVHEIDPQTISGSLVHPKTGSVLLESGVVTITNVDEVNGYISGEFKFNCVPNSLGERYSLLDGVFKDIATIPPL